MSYTPTTWQTGDTITAAGLNKIEQGVANAGSAVIITDDGTALDKTFAEIYNLVLSGTPCYISYTGHKSVSNLDSDYFYSVMLLPIVKVYKYNDIYRVYASSSSYDSMPPSLVSAGTPEIWSYSATSANANPVFYSKVITDNSSCYTELTRQ